MAQLRWQKPADGSDTLAIAQIRWQRTPASSVDACQTEPGCIIIHDHPATGMRAHAAMTDVIVQVGSVPFDDRVCRLLGLLRCLVVIFRGRPPGDPALVVLAPCIQAVLAKLAKCIDVN